MLSEYTRNIQSKVAEICRSGNYSDIDGASKVGVETYRSLIYNVFNDSLDSAFPIARNKLDNERWSLIKNRFIREHKAKSPLLRKLAEEFYEFVRDNNISAELEIPFLSDLLLFEWTEMEIHSMQDKNHFYFKEINNIIEDIPVLNRESKLLHLEYSVFKKEINFAKLNRGNYFLLVFRDPKTQYVRFIELSIFYAVFINIIFENDGIHTKDAALSAGVQFGIEDIPLLIEKVEPFMKDLFEQGMLLGAGY